MEGNEMAVSFKNRIFNRRSGLAGGRMGCTLVTGFLGSGKMTLIRHLVDNRGDLRLAVLVNEFADLDVDSLLPRLPSPPLRLQSHPSSPSPTDVLAVM